MIHPLFQAILNTWIPPLLEQEEPEAFQCKRCHRIYSADDTYEDHLHSLNEGNV